MAELIGGSGYDDVQAAEPSNPSIGDKWLDTSGGDATGKIYADLGNGADWQILPVQDELQSGRTRELLMLLQDKPVPEVQDPLNIQSGLSARNQQTGGDYELKINSNLVEGFEDGDTGWDDSNWSEAFRDISKGLGSTNPISGSHSLILQTPSDDSSTMNIQRDSQIHDYDGIDFLKFTLRLPASQTTEFDDIPIVDFTDSTGSEIRIAFRGNGSVAFDSTDETTWDTGDEVTIELDTTDLTNPTVTLSGDVSYTYSGGSSLDDVSKIGFNCNTLNSNEGGSLIYYVYLDDLKEQTDNANDGYVTDQFAAPTTAPADFKQWNAIQARDVTVGGSTSTDPVEFEILDSTDTTLNSSRIPKARIADEPFTMRNRVYSEDAGNDGQSDYQIATTGDGGHFGIPILTVVSVKKNGSVLDSANWSFDPDTNTVSIDTSNVTIASGDTIDIKYDFDVFDSTLQPRAHLSREDSSETSPSISHFRYEYVI